ncbi:hypothetical protein BC628DRAFT_828873 [Trametes gibbosa]|nr:hypothetical protein BC628DRAFT_828873 [Trametes gibbosa]
MLIEATTTPAEDRPGPDGHVNVRTMHPAAHLHPSSHHRSPSPGRGEYLAVPPPHGRSYVHAAPTVQQHSSGYNADGASQELPQTVNGEQHTYQMHIFTPPVTGAPVKKNKSGNASLVQTAGGSGSVLTLGPTGSVISGPTNLGGGYPPTNSSGQRICRQCGQPGRYKDGKCVEKWGPGPEGPGTVCDRCRKKMKRVERRGTLDSQSLSAQLHHAPAAVHPSGAPQAAPNGRLSGASERSIHRSDTMHVHPSSSQPPSHSRLGPTGTHLISSSNGSSPHSSSYVRHDRDRERDRVYDRAGPSTPHSHYSSNGSGRTAQRSPPTPPAIATLPNSGTNDDEGEARYEGTPRSRGSRVAGRDWSSHTHTHAHKASLSMTVNGHGHASASGSGSGSSRSASRSPRGGAVLGARAATGARGSPRGSDGKSKSSELMDVDADGEEVDAEGDEVDAEIDAEAEAEAEPDADAEADADADAELLEAVDAAEAANATDEEWLKKEDA